MRITSKDRPVDTSMHECERQYNPDGMNVVCHYTKTVLEKNQLWCVKSPPTHL